MVNQISDKEICPEEHREEGSLLNPLRMPVLSERSESKDLSRTLTPLHSYTLLSSSKALMAFTSAAPLERNSLIR